MLIKVSFSAYISLACTNKITLDFKLLRFMPEILLQITLVISLYKVTNRLNNRIFSFVDFILVKKTYDIFMRLY